MFTARSAFAALLWLCLSTPGWAEIDYKGNLGLRGQLFTEKAMHAADKSGNLSAAVEIELYKSFDDGNKSIVFTPFLRAHGNADSLSHADIRELLYLDSSDLWEFSLGIGQVFWGVAESRNVVDVINQIDQLEGFGSASKLGQPLVSLSSIRDWGTLSFFVLPGFRELHYTGQQDRPRLPFAINQDAARFESDDDTSHTDYALRYSHYIDEWDFALSYFSGTARTPLLRPDPVSAAPVFIPYYYQINQFGLEVQATLESWLLKLELIRQSGDAIEDHAEAVAGFEYSFYAVMGSAVDIGVVSEYMWDQRDQATQPFQNDLLLALRFALNDEQSSEALLGVISDLDNEGYTLTLEASRRIGSSFKLIADAVLWDSEDSDDPLSAFNNEDYLQLELGYFF